MNPANFPGSPLGQADFRSLERSFISRELAEMANLRRVTDPEARQLLGIDGRRGNFAGVLLPYFNVATGQISGYRLRRDDPDLEDHGGRPVEKNKYMTRRGEGNHLYFAPWTPASWLADTTIPVVVVEGEKKVLALWSVLHNELRKDASHPSFLPVGIPGVWSWRGRVGKATGPDGRRRDVRGVIPDFHHLVWPGRMVFILFDTNTHTNNDVREARCHLAGWLSGQGAGVRVADLPPEPGINGPDDAAAKHGPEYILGVLAKATPIEPTDNPRVLSLEEEAIVGQQPYGGFLRDYEQYARGCLPDVPREYHVLIGLVLAGGILGGNLATDTGLRPNLAGVIVAFQGSGKSYPTVVARQLIDPIEGEEEKTWKAELGKLQAELRRLEDQEKRQRKKGPDDAECERMRELREEAERMEQGGRPAIVIATQASVEGLLEALGCTPSGIADYDEFGAFLKDCSRDHMRSARENLVKALDCRPIFYRRTRKQSVDARKPCLSLWGTVNVESLRTAASDEDMFGGFFSRILFCAPDYEFAIPFPRPGNEELAEKLRETIRGWRGLGEVRVEFDPGVEKRAVDYAYSVAPFARGERISIIEPEDQVAAVGYVRYRTHALKVAVLLAAGEEGTLRGILRVRMRHILMAIDLVERFRGQTVRLLRHLERRDPLAIDMDKLKAKIRRQPGRDRALYQRLMHWPAHRFNKALCELERLQEIAWDEEQSTGGRKRRLYFPRQKR